MSVLYWVTNILPVAIAVAHKYLNTDEKHIHIAAPFREGVQINYKGRNVILWYNVQNILLGPSTILLVED